MQAILGIIIAALLSQNFILVKFYGSSAIILLDSSYEYPTG